MVRGFDLFSITMAQQESRKRSASSLGYSEPLCFNKNINVEGLAFVAELKQYQLLIPSSKNYFGSFKVPKLMVDDGCSSMLIVLEEPARIDDIFKAFPPQTHNYLANNGYGSGGQTVTFEVKNKSSRMLIPLHLCRDLLPTVPLLSVDMIRFALNSQEEIQYMVDKHSTKLLDGTVQFLQQQAGSRPLKSFLKYSLLGFKILEKVGVVRQGRVQYYFDPEKCTLIDFKAVRDQDKHVEQHLAFKLSPAELQEMLEQELRAEQAARKHGDYVERESLVLWEDELPLHGKEREPAEIQDDEDEGTVCINTKLGSCCSAELILHSALNVFYLLVQSMVPSRVRGHPLPHPNSLLEKYQVPPRLLVVSVHLHQLAQHLSPIPRRLLQI